MTPEEHIERAEWLLSLTDKHGSSVKPVSVKAAEVHVQIAFFKKQYPPEVGRPIQSSGRKHNHVNTDFCKPSCPAYGTDSTNYPRPIADSPQA